MQYVELHCHSAFSFLDGASAPDELARRGRRAGLRGARDHRPRRRLGGDGVRPGVQVVRSPPDRGRGADRRRRRRHAAFHLTLLVETATGWRNLCRLLTEAHAGTRARVRSETARAPVPVRSTRSRSAPRGSSACRGARATALSRRISSAPAAAAAPTRRGDGAGRRLRGRLRAATASGSSSSGRSGATTGRATAGSPGSRSGSASRCVATGNVHAHDPSRAALQDALVAVRLGGDARGDGARAARQRDARAWRPRARWPRASREHPDAVAETGRLAERLSFDLTRDLGYRYPGRRGRRRRPRAGRDLRARLERALRRHARARGGAAGAWRRSCG